MLAGRAIGRATTRNGEAALVAAAVAIAAVTVIVWSWLGWTLARESLFFDDTRFSIVRWEMQTFANRWLYQLGAGLRDDPSDNEALTRYFSATSEIVRIEREAGATPSAEQSRALSTLRAERRRLENHVEAAIERRVSSVLAAEGLRFNLPSLLPTLVWPPVDFELTSSPWVLAESPRREIRLIGDDLLSTGLSPEEVLAIEQRATEDDSVAVAFSTGGVAAYPSIVDESATYERMVEIAAHEWLHQYLFFYPLGRRYYGDLRDVNETVATIGGEGIAALVFARYPRPQVPEASPPADRSQVDLPAVLNQLRRDVDRLLTEGKVAEAEALMEARRIELAERGVSIRRLNQAYLAFRGLYATTGASGTDLGTRLQGLRERSGSVGAFIRAVRDIKSKPELEAALSRQ